MLKTRMICAGALAAALFCGFDAPELKKMRTTAYCLPGKTFSETDVRDGIGAAGDPRLLGRTVVLYQRKENGEIGDFIGIYEIEDTGCNEHVIDVWCRDREACQRYMDRVYADGCKGRVWALVVEGEG